jgi:putative sigma-54 modulation protein
MTVTDEMKDRVTKKLQRLSKYLPDDVDVFVVMKAERQNTIFETTIPLANKRQVRAVSIVKNWRDGVDNSYDALERQIVKYKQRLKNQSRRNIRYKEELGYFAALTNEPEATEEETGVVIVKSKKFALKPMDAEEAAMNMDLLGHSFFVFRNAITDGVNVIYKREDGKYGLIEPIDN